MKLNADVQLKEDVLNAAIQHSKAEDKVMTCFRIRWTKINGALCVAGVTVQYKPKEKPKKRKV